LVGKTIFIYAEQGLGDTLQFCRYLPLLEAMGARIVFAVQPSLLTLCASLTMPLTLVAQGQNVPDYDYQCSLLSLPLAFGTALQTIPARTPYLFADAEKVSYWRRRLAAHAGRKVGLVWSGAANHKNDHNRSLALAKILPLFELQIEFHVLQKEFRADDAVLLADYPHVLTHQHDLHDFADTAALLECLDLVISVDTSVAHLAGAMGKPVWILLPANPDFRWLLERSDSPWYPTATLFRQGEDREWSTVISAVQQSLINRLLPG
jgi:ADP-heptose:LPS heptosyltransferase